MGCLLLVAFFSLVNIEIIYKLHLNIVIRNRLKFGASNNHFTQDTHLQNQQNRSKVYNAKRLCYKTDKQLPGKVLPLLAASQAMSGSSRPNCP
jgi:hypothetical protein